MKVASKTAAFCSPFIPIVLMRPSARKKSLSARGRRIFLLPAKPVGTRSRFLIVRSPETQWLTVRTSGDLFVGSPETPSRWWRCLRVSQVPHLDHPDKEIHADQSPGDQRTCFRPLHPDRVQPWGQQ